MAHDEHYLFVSTSQGKNYAGLDVEVGSTTSLLDALASFNGMSTTCALDLSGSVATLEPCVRVCSFPVSHVLGFVLIIILSEQVPISPSTQLCNLVICRDTRTMVFHAKMEGGPEALILLRGYKAMLHSRSSDRSAPDPSIPVTDASYMLTILLPNRLDDGPLPLSANGGRTLFSFTPDRLNASTTLPTKEPCAMLLDWKFALSLSDVRVHQLASVSLSRSSTLDLPSCGLRRKSIESSVPTSRTSPFLPVIVCSYTPTGVTLVLESAQSAGRTAVASTKPRQVLCRWDWNPLLPVP